MIYTIDPQTQQFDPEALRIAYLGTDVIGISTAGNQITLQLAEGSTYDPMPILEAHVVQDWKTERISTEARNKRNALLAASDWTVLADAPLTTTQKTNWKNYRQALRDISTQAGFPNVIDRPVEP